MTAIFNLWNFYQYPDASCAFDLTLANAPGFREGTPELIAACLRGCGLEARPASWRVTPFRSHYFTDYGDSDDWMARWDVGWAVHVNTDPPSRARQNSLSAYPTRIDLTDETWDFDFEDPRHDRAALLVAVLRDNPSAAGAERLADSLLARAEAECGRRLKMRAETRAFADGELQLRALFEGDIFPDHAETFDGLVELCRRGGVIVNRSELLTPPRGSGA